MQSLCVLKFRRVRVPHGMICAADYARRPLAQCALACLFHCSVWGPLITHSCVCLLRLSERYSGQLGLWLHASSFAFFLFSSPLPLRTIMPAASEGFVLDSVTLSDTNFVCVLPYFSTRTTFWLAWSATCAAFLHASWHWLPKSTTKSWWSSSSRYGRSCTCADSWLLIEARSV